MERTESDCQALADLVRRLAEMPITATVKDFDPLVKAARDLLERR